MTQPSKTTVIAIAGASASGKSLFAQTIYQELLSELGPDGISIIKEDSYYREQSHLTMDERIQTNYDHPNAFEHELLSAQLNTLITQQHINCPVYCYKTHTRTTEFNEIKPTPIVLVEGILLFSNPESFAFRLAQLIADLAPSTWTTSVCFALANNVDMPV